MNSGLQDILPPPHAPAGIGMLTVVTAITLLLVSVVLLRYYLAPRNRARRLVYRLRTTLNKGNIDTRSAAHALALSLRHGLGKDFAICAEATHWATFSCRLSEARFALQPCSVKQLDALLEEALFWLERSR